MPETRSIFGLKRPVISDCQAALFDVAVSLAHISVKMRDCCKSQTPGLRHEAYMTFYHLAGRKNSVAEFVGVCCSVITKGKDEDS